MTRDSRGALVPILGGIAAVLASLLALMHVDASRKSSRAAAEASRLAVRIFEDASSDGLKLSLDASVILDHADAEARAALLLTSGHAGLSAIGSADARAARRLKRAGASTIGMPLGPEGAVALVSEQARLLARLKNEVTRQNRALEQSRRYGRRAGTASRGLVLVATAGALLTLAASLGTKRDAAVAIGSASLLLAAAAAILVMGIAP